MPLIDKHVILIGYALLYTQTDNATHGYRHVPVLPAPDSRGTSRIWTGRPQRGVGARWRPRPPAPTSSCRASGGPSDPQHTTGSEPTTLHTDTTETVSCVYACVVFVVGVACVRRCVCGVCCVCCVCGVCAVRVRCCELCDSCVLWYRDDVQDTEKAVDAVSWVNLLHHVLLSILRDRDTHVLSFMQISF